MVEYVAKMLTLIIHKNAKRKLVKYFYICGVMINTNFLYIPKV